MSRPSDKQQTAFELVAHRGFASRYPENTLVALQAAFEAGAHWIEFDVQLSADGVPVLCHDASLARTSGADVSILDTPWEKLRYLEVNEPGRFDRGFRGVLLPSLQQVVDLLGRWGDRQAFAELKRESLHRHGIVRSVGCVLKVLQPVLDRCVVISYDQTALIEARQQGRIRIGRVLEAWDSAIREEVTALSPEFLVCNHTCVPRGERLWPGPWKWVLYEADTTGSLQAIRALEPDLIETRAIGELPVVPPPDTGDPDE